MTYVWPTVDVLKALKKGNRLPPQVEAELEDARIALEPEVKLQHLVQAFEFAVDQDPLIADAQKRFSAGTPTVHTAMTSKARKKVYEVRDRQSPAWRGAVIFPDKDTDAWLVHVDRHDNFHRLAPKVINSKLKVPKLSLKVRDRCITRIRTKRAQIEILRGVIEALQSSIKEKKKQQVQMPNFPRYGNVAILVDVNPSLNTELEIEEAHDELSSIRLEFTMKTMDEKPLKELLHICIPFLQPDNSLVESIYAPQNMAIEIIVTKARLIHLLSIGEETNLDLKKTPDKPAVLHYTSINGLTKAYVEGCAVQAVCGRWWIPIGDETTHPHLPICPECEKEKPFAQALASLNRRK